MKIWTSRNNHVLWINISILASSSSGWFLTTNTHPTGRYIQIRLLVSSIFLRSLGAEQKPLSFQNSCGFFFFGEIVISIFLNRALMLSTVYPACYLWYAWEIPSYLKVGSWEIREDYMRLAECITSLRENFAGKSHSNSNTTIPQYYQSFANSWWCCNRPLR